MKFFLSSVFVLLFVLTLGAQTPDLKTLLPQAAFKASLMKLAFDKNADDISFRFNKAIAQSPEWFNNYLKTNAGVVPLPYHQNFGITREEYGIMLKSFESRHLERIQEVRVEVRDLPGDSFRFDCVDLGKSFSGIIIDTSSASLMTPWLVIDRPDGKTSGTKEDGNPFGVWKGVCWKKVVADKAKGDFKSVSLYVGKSETTGLRFFALRVKVMEANKIRSNFETLLQFE